MGRARARAGAAVVAIAWVVGGLAAEPAQAQAPKHVSGVRYTFTPDAALDRMDVRVCFDGAAPGHLVPGAPVWLPYLSHARRLPGGAALRTDDTGLVLDGVPPGSCVGYRVDLTTAAARRPRDEVHRFGTGLLATPDLWMWHPDPVPAHPDVRARFVLPKGISVSVPWPCDASMRCTVPATSFPWRINAAFGVFHVREVHAAGAVLQVAEVGAPIAAGDTGIDRWISASARAVATLYDGFPAKSLQVILLPVRGDQVVFGSTSHGGGPSVTILVGKDTKEAALAADWIAPHELVHVGQPHFHGADAWLFEGLATYYGPLTRARVGLLTPRLAWQALVDGFARGRSEESPRTVGEDSATMAAHHLYWRVYWAGAAIALETDVAMRRGGKGSLDAAVRRMRARCDPTKAWSARDAIAMAGAGPMWTIATKVLGGTGFPDVSATLAWLGVKIGPHGRVTLDDRAPGAKVRRAITAPGR